jgi:hypothetical protein
MKLTLYGTVRFKILMAAMLSFWVKSLVDSSQHFGDAVPTFIPEDADRMLL